MKMIKPIVNLSKIAEGYDTFIFGFNGVLYDGGSVMPSAAECLKNNAKYFCASKELTLSESSPLCADNAFALCAGGIKVMDLIYCPFGRTCSSCDKRGIYTLTDDAGREFPLRRYETSLCRFELYNCANLLTPRGNFGALADFTVMRNPAELSLLLGDEAALKAKLNKVTRGHGQSPVL